MGLTRRSKMRRDTLPSLFALAQVYESECVYCVTEFSNYCTCEFHGVKGV